MNEQTERIQDALAALMVPCEDCDTTGHHRVNDPAPCPDCHGTGEIPALPWMWTECDHYITLSDGRIENFQADCPRCRNDGWFRRPPSAELDADMVLWLVEDVDGMEVKRIGAGCNLYVEVRGSRFEICDTNFFCSCWQVIAWLMGVEI